MDRNRDAFECAFVATSYALDRRGDELVAPLLTVGDEASKLVRALAAPERQTRAVVLARELSRLVQALEGRRLA